MRSVMYAKPHCYVVTYLARWWITFIKKVVYFSEKGKRKKPLKSRLLTLNVILCKTDL